MDKRAIQIRDVMPSRHTDALPAEQTKIRADAPDPARLREELAAKQRLLNVLESRGIVIEQAGDVKARIAAAISDLDAIIEKST